MSYAKRIVRADPFPFRVGAVRLASPGWLSGQYTEHDPREEYGVAEQGTRRRIEGVVE